ncbi:LOW QUALITY PROTEIN: hypothetical protein V2J09_006367 [Rumex salicifolius]
MNYAKDFNSAWIKLSLKGPSKRVKNFIFWFKPTDGNVKIKTYGTLRDDKATMGCCGTSLKFGCPALSTILVVVPLKHGLLFKVSSLLDTDSQLTTLLLDKPIDRWRSSCRSLALVSQAQAQTLSVRTGPSDSVTFIETNHTSWASLAFSFTFSFDPHVLNDPWWGF